MKKEKILILIISLCSVLSCSIINEYYFCNNQISLEEANRILQESLTKIDVLKTNSEFVLIRNDINLDNGKIIKYDTNSIKKLDLSYFHFINKNENFKLVNLNEISKGDKLIDYLTISFNKTHNERFIIWICSGFYIPKIMQPIDIDGMCYTFKYKIVKGKAELERWGGN